MAEIDDVRNALSQLFGRLSGFWGITPASGRLYAWLLSVEGSLTAEELMEALQMSRGAVSMAARELVDLGLVLQQQEPGSRRVSYRVEADLERAIRNIIQARKRLEWDPLLSNLREWGTRLERERSSEAVVMRERLASIESLVGLADSMAESFLKGGMVQKLGLKMLVGAANARRKREKSKS
ncbi:MAG: MarR family transcriptional regulator [Planctomycetes bacterium]|nr:MarR family transcriptional regulator [Planctomycetota bacterium]